MYMEFLKYPRLFIAFIRHKLSGQEAFGGSVDITNRCNLSCAHCYWQKQNHESELSDKTWLKKLQELRRQGIFHLTFAGGEPLLRKNLLKKATRIFPFNWIVTNGTLPIPNFAKTTIFVSIDGDQKTHDQIRGQGVWIKARQNINNSSAKIIIGCVINNLNKDQLESTIKDWVDTNVLGINFDFHSPTTDNDPLIITPEEKQEIARELQILKKKYPGFIFLPDRVIELLTKESQTVTSDCPLPGNVISLDSAGKQKKPCIMAGTKCATCGCIIPFFGHALGREKDKESIKIALKTLT